MRKIFELKSIRRLSVVIIAAGVFASCSFLPGQSSPTTTTTTATTTTTIAPLTCAKGGVCVLGDTGPGGGRVMYVASEPFTSEYSHCSAECKDFLGNPSIKEISTCRDSCYYLEVSHIDVATGLDWEEATRRVSDWNGSGLTDWFLPTVEQFYLLSRAADDCEFFKSSSGEYSPDYWTSSWDGEYNQPKFFSLGSCGTGRTWYKNPSNARPIRAG